MSLTALDIFCGAAGGWSLGLHRAGIQTIAACEIDPWRRAAYSSNFPSVRMYDDVRELSAVRIVRDLGRLPDIIVGSPPCQDASSANTKGRGLDGGRTGLFFEAVRLVREIRPAWAALENVPAIRARGIDRVLFELESIDYACWPLVVGADDIGAPHRRKRMWLIATDTNETRRAPFWQGITGDVRPQCQAAERAPGAFVADAAPERCQARPIGNAHQSGLAGLARGEKGTVGISNDADPDQQNEPRLSQHGEMARRLADRYARVNEWNGGPVRHLELAHGVPAGLARAGASAFGDSVCPQITEAIGRAILSVEARAA